MDKLNSLLNIVTPVEETAPDGTQAPRAKVKPLRPARRPVPVPARTPVPDEPVEAEAPARPRPKPARPASDRGGVPFLDDDISRITADLPKRKRAKRSIGLWASFLLLVALPTLAAGLYYLAFASNQYVSEFRFAVRSQDFAPAGSSAASTALNGAARAGMFTDNFLVVDYLQSRQAVEDLTKTIDLQKIFTESHIDPLSRLRGDGTMEDLVRYWQSMIDASFDLSTGLALVRVRAFNPNDAYNIAATLVSQSERLVNDITARARRDAVKFAEADVSRAEDRLRAARADLRQFRDIQQTPDAARTAGGTLDLAMKLRAEAADLQSQLTTLRSYMDPNAPTVRVLESRIAATNKQIASIERELGKGVVPASNPAPAGVASGAVPTPAPAPGVPAATGGAPVMSDMLSNYEDVDLSRQFAEKYYDTTLTALELARSEAATQQTYVATYVQPTMPEASLYPQRGIATFIVFLACAALWFVGVMIFFSIRDHVA